MIFYHFSKPRCFQFSKTSLEHLHPLIPYLGSHECLQNQAHVQKQVTNCWAFFYPEMAEDNKIEADLWDTAVIIHDSKSMGAVSSHSARRWEHTKQAMAWLSHHSKTVATLSIIVHLSILCSHFLVEWHSGQHDWKIPRDCKCGKRDCNWDQPNEYFSLSQFSA